MRFSKGLGAFMPKFIEGVEFKKIDG